MRPSRYMIQFESKTKVGAYLLAHPEDKDLVNATPDDTYAYVDAGEYLPAARIQAQEIAAFHDTTAVIYERVGLEDVTPSEDIPGLVWDWSEERVVAEVSA